MCQLSCNDNNCGVLLCLKHQLSLKPTWESDRCVVHYQALLCFNYTLLTTYIYSQLLKTKLRLFIAEIIMFTFFHSLCRLC